MGLSRASIAWLMEESQRRPFKGTLLTLGVQNVYQTQLEFENLARTMGVELGPAPSDDRTVLVENTISADHVFRRLGFERVVTTDADPFEGCDFTFDLNEASVPPEHLGQYDMVLDGGTLEHIFHVPNALSNLLRFARDDGRIVHHAPSSNHIDHGFWMFSPALFWDYYSANGLELPRFDIVRYRQPADKKALWDFATYRPNALAKQMFGGLGGGCFALALVAEKIGPVADPVVPQQGMYAQAWADKSPPGIGAATARTTTTRQQVVAMRERIYGFLPVEWRIRWRSATRRFPLKIRRRM